MGTVIQMYSSVAPAEALANIDVPMNGKLIGVDWAVVAAASAADFTLNAHLSFTSTSQATANDARGTISNISVGADLTTSGGPGTHANKYVALPDIDVGMGERIFLHAAGTAIVVTIRVCLHFSFDMDKQRSRSR